MTQRHSLDMTKGGCNEPLLPGEPAPPCVPPVGVTPGLALTVHLRSASRVMLSGVIGLADQQPAGTSPVAVGATLLVDGSYTEELQMVNVAGAQRSQLAIQALANLKSGTHTLGVRIAAEYSSRAQGDVMLGPLALDASALPSLGDGR